MPDEAELRAQVNRLSNELDQRASTIGTLDRYYDGNHPIPEPVIDAKATRAYRTLMGLAVANWPALVVDSVEERLEVTGIRFGDQPADDDVWNIWQANGLDAESSTLHQSTLVDGRGYAIVWTDANGDPEITLEHASMCVVEYEPGSRRRRRAALRRWADGDVWYANLYRPEGIYKFVTDELQPTTIPDADSWLRRDVPDEDWPLANPLQQVNVVEFAVNRTLRPGSFGTAAGEFERSIGHINRINYKVFCGLVALTWSGFPLRALIGDPILRDDNGNALPPFDVAADKLVQIENPDGKLVQLPEANIDNYSPEMDIKHLAAITKTPPHYLLGEMVNLSADAIRAAEAALVSKTRKHHRALGEAWEEVARLAVLAKDPADPRGQQTNAEIVWKDPESRSMAERADSATKLKDILPWPAIAQYVLQATPQEINRWAADRSSSALLNPPPAAPAPAGP